MLFYVAIFLVLPSLVFALNISAIIDRAINMVLWPIFLGAVVIMLIFAGFLFVTASGDPSKVSTAKKAVLWTIIGIVVGIAAFSAYGIIGGVIGGTETVSCTQNSDGSTNCGN